MKNIPISAFVLLAGTVCAYGQALTPEEGNAALAAASKSAREAARALSFEAFRDQTLYLEETGKFYVNGDTPIRNEKLLKEFWTQNVANEPRAAGGEVAEFAVLHVGGLDMIWPASQRHTLTYCVSTDFGFRHPAVVADMTSATAALEAVADIGFQYISSQDPFCDQNNPNVLFDVRPVDAGGQFLAAAFFPNDPRPARSVVIDPSSFQLDPNDALTLRGILRHELGHTIGGRHEHTRPEAGACFEDADWRGVTDYDAFSFMHYPQCNGQGDWSLRLTEKDKSGIACLYGAAAGFEIDTSICRQSVGDEVAETTTIFSTVTLAEGETVPLGDVSVAPGTRLEVVMTGTGDPDLYVKLDRPATVANYDCRPYSDGAEETCLRDVPPGKAQAFIMVRGYREGTASVSATHTPQ